MIETPIKKKSSFKIQIRLGRYINLPNIFLGGLILLTLFNCLLSFEQSDITQVESRASGVRVLRREQNQFNQTIYSVQEGNKVWLMQSKRFLEVGRKITIYGQFTPYRLDKDSDKYNLSLGSVGQIKNAQLLEFDISCDFICSVLSYFQNLSQKIESHYSTLMCDSFKVNLLTPLFSTFSCRNVAALSAGLVVGGSNDFDAQTKQDLKELSLTHIVAVSGFQVVLIVQFIEMVISKLRWSRAAKFYSTNLILLSFLGLVGFEPPILRALLTYWIVSLSLMILGRRLQYWRGLIYAGMILLWVNPFYLLSASFQLSFLASFGLSMWQSSVDKLELGANLLDALKSTITSFLWTLPVVVGLNGQINLIGLVVNVLLTPFIPVLTITNLLTFIPWLGDFLGFLVAFTQSLLFQILSYLTSAFEVINLKPPESWVEWLFYYLFLWLFIKLFHKLPLFLDGRITKSV